MDDAEYRALAERMEGVITRNTLALEAVVTVVKHVNRSLDDLSDQVRANTTGLLKALDRFDAPGGTAY